MDVKKALKAEIERVARRQIRQETESLRKSVARYRGDIAALKREHKALQRQLQRLTKSAPQPAEPEPENGARQIRFAPAWLKKHRQKLGLTAADYGRLVGVHPITIYNWEQGKSKPRAAQLKALAAVRSLGKREAQRKLTS